MRQSDLACASGRTSDMTSSSNIAPVNLQKIQLRISAAEREISPPQPIEKLSIKVMKIADKNLFWHTK